MGKDSAARIRLGRSFQQMGTVNEKVCESDFVPLWDGIVMHRSLAEQYTILQVLSNRYRKTSLLRRKRSLTATNRMKHVKPHKFHMAYSKLQFKGLIRKLCFTDTALYCCTTPMQRTQIIASNNASM